jgi:7-carboxy-7-deazaguanine synthase
MTDSLMVNEIYRSIQGESTRAGLPCVFVRLTGCHLRCGYCDTEYAFHEGRRMTVAKVIGEVDRACGRARSALVEITGGEPLLQPNVHRLMARLCDAGRTVLVETSGACDISVCDDRVIRIMDLKTPGSGEVDRNRWTNIEHLGPRDEVKFVLTRREDYEWARDVTRRYDLPSRVNAVLFSAVHAQPAGSELPGAGGLPLSQLAEWVLADGLNVRIQTQLHKLIWHPTTRGV